MPMFLRRLFGRSDEVKSSRVGPLVALASGGRAGWSSRDPMALTGAAFSRNAIGYRCVKMISEGAASVRTDLFSGSAELDEHALMRMVQRPNPRQAGADFFESVYANLLCFGNAYIELVQDDRGIPRELYNLRPDRVRIEPGPDGWPEAYTYTAAGGAVRLGADGPIPSVLHLRAYDPLNDLYGMSPLAAAHVAIDIHNAASNWNKALLDNSARPSGALVYAAGGANMTDDQFDRLKDELELTFSGSHNAGRPILLEGGLDWKPLALTPKDMDFMQAKTAAAREIALALGVPPLLLGLPGDNTFANYAEANRALWRQTILPLVNRTMQSLVSWLQPAFAEKELRLAVDLEQVEALSPERDALWKRLEGASFLSVAEKRQQAGFRGDVPAELVRDAKAVTGREGMGGKPSRPFDWTPARPRLAAKFDPAQPRDEQGRWTSGGGDGGVAD